MIPVFVAGGIAGLGAFLLVLALVPRPVSLTRRLADFEARQWKTAQPRARLADGGESEVSLRLGRLIARLCAEQGWEFPSLRANLAVVGKSFESYAATKVLLSLLGLLLAPIGITLLSLAGIHLSIAIPLWLGLSCAAVFFFLPDLELKQQADRRRRDFRHAVSVFLDLVAMNLAGGRGVPEALMSASEIGNGWAVRRIRDTLLSARITGQTPWQALGVLGEEVQVDELRDLATALSLVAEDGAKVRESLVVRAASLRRRQLADLQGQAAERSQSMLIAQLLLAVAFLLFLVYPAVRLLLGV
jgi:tight adherence protein C